MKLYRFRYSPYARKVQLILDLVGRPYQLVDVAYADRNELAELTSGYIHVPVLVTDDGKVIVESRAICEHLLAGPGGAALVPSPFEGPIWAYHDFCDGPLEDVLFRIAVPGIRDAWPTAGERALYTVVKERKFGTGCVDAWRRDMPALLAKAQHLLAPTRTTLAQTPFLFGAAPTFADVALYGQLAMLDESGSPAVRELGLANYKARLEAAVPRRT